VKHAARKSARFILDFLFYPEDGDYILYRNVY
jgi:hypothetical protein